MANKNMQIVNLFSTLYKSFVMNICVVFLHCFSLGHLLNAWINRTQKKISGDNIGIEKCSLIF